MTKLLFTEYRVRLERLAPGEMAVSLPDPENIGLRTKLGGEPDWIQGDETPVCTSCGEEMSLVAQIDSIDALGGDSSGPYQFGDAGMLYLFYCGGCAGTAVVQQSY